MSPASSHTQESACHFIEVTWVPLHRVGQEARTVGLSSPFFAPQGRIRYFSSNRGIPVIFRDSRMWVFLQISGHFCTFILHRDIPDLEWDYGPLGYEICHLNLAYQCGLLAKEILVSLPFGLLAKDLALACHCERNMLAYHFGLLAKGFDLTYHYGLLTKEGYRLAYHFGLLAKEFRLAYHFGLLAKGFDLAYRGGLLAQERLDLAYLLSLLAKGGGKYGLAYHFGLLAKRNIGPTTEKGHSLADLIGLLAKKNMIWKTFVVCWPKRYGLAYHFDLLAKDLARPTIVVYWSRKGFSLPYGLLAKMRIGLRNHQESRSREVNPSCRQNRFLGGSDMMDGQ
ncbi:hypothetical protein Taro_010822 [Colocasia esculenta]|uniref:Uncharacterized protein n=1 Tax=Colocasia esculenta TaxID=4460 RepID=A0A843U8J2_COLES|nr:hypothetical protein [Colocasia esculenta]